MKKIIFLNTFLILIFLMACSVQEVEPEKKYSQIVSKYTEIKQIISEEVNDTFSVYVRLPKNYDESNKRYPVLYLLDGDISFNMAISVVRYLQFGKDVPDLIVAAPAYGTLLNDSEINYRERDYTVSKIERFANSSGTDNYSNFLKEELVPLVDSTYRTNDQRILNGYSLGGLFAIHTLLTNPDLFDHYIAGSPYLVDDLDQLVEKSKTLYNEQLKNKLFISVGEFEDSTKYHEPITKMVNHLRRINGLDIRLSTFKNGTHFTCPSEALAYGLKFIFGQNQ